MNDTSKYHRGPLPCWGAEIEEGYHPDDCEGHSHHVVEAEYTDRLGDMRVAYLCPPCTRIGLRTSAIRAQLERPPMTQRDDGIWTTNMEKNTDDSN